jgi:hypothetical protein
LPIPSLDRAAVDELKDLATIDAGIWRHLKDWAPILKLREAMVLERIVDGIGCGEVL